MNHIFKSEKMLQMWLVLLLCLAIPALASGQKKGGAPASHASAHRGGGQADRRGEVVLPEVRGEDAPLTRRALRSRLSWSRRPTLSAPRAGRQPSAGAAHARSTARSRRSTWPSGTSASTTARVRASTRSRPRRRRWHSPPTFSLEVTDADSASATGAASAAVP